eukprot:jgi/Picre1/32194/NNA_007540.t1
MKTIKLINRKPKRLGHLSETSSEVTHLGCDLSFREDWDLIIENSYGRTITGVVHSAGITKDSAIESQNMSSIRQVLAPKLSLRGATGILPLQKCILFSSIASLIGSAGQLNYCAANGALDAFSSECRSTGILALSIQWGAWSQGMASTQAVRKAASRSGVVFLEPWEAVDCLKSVLLNANFLSISSVPIFKMEWKRTFTLVGSVPYFLAEIHEETAGVLAANNNAIRSRSDIPKYEDIDSIQMSIQKIAEGITGAPIGLDDPFMDVGVDSLGLVELQNSLNKVYPYNIDATEILNYPTVRALSGHVLLNFEGNKTGNEQNKIRTSMQNGLNDTPKPVFIRYIAQKATIDKLVTENTDKVIGTPICRWNTNDDSVVNHKLIVRFGVFLRDLFAFDHLLFKLSLTEALSIDPQQRLLLENSLEISQSVAVSKSCSVMVGIGAPDYQYHVTWIDANVYSASGCANSVASGRISYLFDLNGPCASIDTACSSSMVALHYAYNEMKWSRYQEGMLSLDGRCKTLDAEANGYVRSESCTSMLLTYMQEENLGAVFGTSVGQDGKSGSLTAPNGPAQQRVILSALENSKISAVEFHIEMHGTGTELGDPIEYGSILQTSPSKYITFSASKTDYGHCETAAGLLSVVNVVQQPRRNSVQQIRHLRFINSYIDRMLENQGSNVFQARQDAPIARHCDQRLLGASSFAFQGTNAHTVCQASSFGQMARKLDDAAWKKAVLSTIPPMANVYKVLSIRKTSVHYTAIKFFYPINCLQVPEMASFAMISETFQEFSASAKLVFCRNVGRRTVQDTEDHVNSISFDIYGVCEVRLGEHLLQNKLQCLHSLAGSQNQPMPKNKALGWKLSIDVLDSSRPLIADMCHVIGTEKSLNVLEASSALYFYENCSSRIPLGTQLSIPFDYCAIACSHIAKSFRHDIQTIRAESFSIHLAGATNNHVSEAEYVSRHIRMKPAITEGILKILSFEQQGHRSLGDPLEPTPTSGDLKHLKIGVSCELKASFTDVPEIAVSSLDQMMAVCSLSDSTHVFGLVDENKNILSPYKSSMIWFYELCGLLDIQVKHSLVSLPEMDNRTSHLPCAALAQGVSMTAMLECRRDFHQPMINIRSNCISTTMIKAALSISSEFSIDVHENCISTDRLVRSTQPRRAERSRHTLSSTTRCIVISGGTRGLGLFAAKQFAQKECVLLLTSLSGVIEKDALLELNKKAHSVIVRICDWSIPESVNQLFLWIAENMPPVHIVVHAAGMMVPRYIVDMDEHCFNETTSCKVHSLTCSMEFPVIKTMIISSISGIWSQSGGSHYAAASVFQLKTAEWHTSVGRNVKAVAFGPFAEIGMAADYSGEMRLLGLDALRPSALVKGFQACGACATIVYAKISERHLVNHLTHRGSIGLLDMLPAEVPGDVAADRRVSERHPDKQRTCAELEGVKRMTRASIIEVVNSALHETIGESGESAELVGLDSLTVVEVSNQLSELMGVALPATLLYDYPTFIALVDYLDRQFGSKRTSFHEETVGIATEVDTEKNLVIASLYARLPQTVNNDAVTCGPVYRCAFAFDEGSSIPFGSWLDSIEYFDNLAFSMSTNEARVLDPQHRALLELVFEACSERDFKEATNTNTSVYVGMQHAEYIHLYALHNREINAFSATSSAFSVAAGRISYTFSLKGPSMSVDTACSSALCAAHLGRQDILNARSSGAISSTVNMMLSSDTTRSTNVSGMLSKDGRCKTFDSSADGYVRAEGVAALAMERSKIINDEISLCFGDKFLMVSSFVNQDGRTNTLTAPNGPSQQKVILGALAAGTASHSSIKALQLHGTGTALGDPIETRALQNVFKETMSNKTASAAKSIHGHLEPASGFVGLYHAAIQLKFEQASPVQHLKSLNRYIAKDESVDKSLPKIQRQSAILLTNATDAYQGVSAFAFQGTNSHIIISTSKGYCRKSEYMFQWRKSRFWYAVASNRLLSVCATNESDTATFTCALTAKFSYILEHIVRDKIVFPAAAMIMASFAAIDAVSNNSNFSLVIQNLAIHRAMTIGSSSPHNLLDIVVKQNQVLLIGKGANISEATVASHLEQNSLSKKKMSVKDRLYDHFIRGARRSLGVMFLSALSDRRTLMPIGCTQKSTTPEEIGPNVLDAASHVLAGGMKPNDYLFLPTMLESAKYQRQDRVSEDVLTCCSESAYSEEEISSDMRLEGQEKVVFVFMSNFVVKSLKQIDTLQSKSKSLSISRTPHGIDQGRLEIVITVSATVKNILGAEVPNNLPLFEAGVDSLVSLDIVDQINARFGLNLPATLLYDAPTIDAIAALITETLPTTDLTQTQDAPDIKPNILVSRSHEDDSKSTVEITGYCFRYAGDGSDFSEGDPFILSNEGCSAVPHQRWDNDAIYAPRSECGPRCSYVAIGKFLKTIDLFDAELFSISDHEAGNIDPQQRLLMEEVLFLQRKSFASQSKIALNTGVFVGCMYQEYLQLQYSHGSNITASLITGNGLSYLPARISYTFNFKGPSLGADTACSSSLVSLHEGARCIQQDALQNSVVSGVNSIILQSTTISICQMGALSESARCKTFDSTADGYGRGEGIVSMLLAEFDAKHQSVALLRSSLINQDGRSNGITAPNGNSQSELIMGSLERAGDGDYSLHSCHGTGTELGDPIEVSAMVKAISSIAYSKTLKMTISSSKSILGHTEGAAGLTGLLLCAKSLGSRNSSAVANLRKINPYVSSTLNSAELSECLHVSRELTLRMEGRHDIFGTSSFGMGGTNAHASISHNQVGEYLSKKSDFNILLSQQKYWPLFPSSLHMRFYKRSPEGVKFSLVILKPQASYLVDHNVQGRSLVPGALWIDIGLCCFAMINMTKTAGHSGLQKSIFRAPHILSDKDLEVVVAANIELRSGEITLNETKKADRVYFEAAYSPASIQTGKKMETKRIVKISNVFSAPESPKANASVKPCMADGHTIHPAELDTHFHLLAAISKEFIASIPTQLDFFIAVSSNSSDTTERSPSISGCVETSGPVTISSIVGESLSQGHAVITKGLRSTQLSRSIIKTKSPVFIRNASKSTGQMEKDQLYSVEYHADDLPTDHRAKILGYTYIGFGNVNVRMESKVFPPEACINHTTLAAQVPTRAVHLELHARNSFQITPKIQGALDLQERSLWALYRVLKSESRQRLNLTSVQLDHASKHAPKTMGKVVGTDGCALNAGAIFRPQLAVSKLTNIITKPRSQAKQTSIILGGTDGIGLLTLRYQSIRVGSSLTLATGRSGRLRTSGSVSDGTLLKSDMSFTGDLEEIVRRREVFYSIFHSGGLNDDKAIGGQNPYRIRRVFAPKSASLNSLSGIFKLTPSSDSYFFSSISPLIGSPGQSNYASANYYLEGHGLNLQNSGCNVTSIAWGAWSGIGMAKFRGDILKRTSAYGLGTVSPISGLASLAHLMQSGKMSKVVIASPFNFDGDFWRDNTLLENHERNLTSGTGTVVHHSHEIHRESVARGVLQIVTDLLGKDIARREPLMNAGLDSLTAIELQDTLADAFHINYQILCGRIYARFGAFLSSVSYFDNELFGISVLQATYTDPQQRLLLHAAYKAINQCREVLTSNDLGNFIGCMNFDYSHVLSTAENSMSSYSATGTSGNFMVGRLSYHFALTGPAASIDTACSSSLVAVHLSSKIILQGEVKDSIAGGVNLMLSPAVTMALCRLNALSLEGRCKTLDSLANGYGRSEAVLLTILSSEDTIGSPSIAIVSSYVNQDGQSSSLTSPCGPSQSRLILRAAEQGMLPLSSITTYSLHGTGTSLGDPIEVNALMNAFSGHHKDGLSIAAFKSITGHTEGAAGLSGLLQILVSVRDSYVPLINHLVTPNTFVVQTLEDNTKFGPVFIPREGTCMAAASLGQTSSFGMSGTNASSIIQKTRDANNNDRTLEVKSLHFRSSSLWPAAIPKHYCGKVRQLRPSVTFEFDLRRADTLLTHIENVKISSMLGLCFSLAELVCESRVVSTVGSDLNHIMLQCQNQAFSFSWPRICVSLSISDGSLTFSSSKQKSFEFTIAMAQKSMDILKEPRKKVFDFPNFQRNYICTATIQHNRSNLNSTAIQSLIELRRLVSNHEDTEFNHLTVQGARDEDWDRPMHEGCVCHHSGGRILDTAINLGISCQSSFKAPASKTNNELMTHLWKPKHITEAERRDNESGKIGLFMLEALASAKCQVEAFNDCLRIGRVAPSEAHLFDVSLSSIEHLICALMHSDIAHLLLTNDFSCNRVKCDQDTDVLISIYDMMTSINWNRSLTVSPLSIIPSHPHEPHQRTIKQYEATLSLSKTIFLESRQLFAPSIKLVNSEGLTHALGLETLRHLLTCTGEYEFQLNGQRCYVLRIQNGRHKPRHAPKVPTSILVYGGTKGIGFEYIKSTVLSLECQHTLVTSSKGYLPENRVHAFRKVNSIVSIILSDSTLHIDNGSLEKQLREEFPHFEQRVFATGISANDLIGGLDTTTFRKIVSHKVNSVDFSLRRQTYSEVYLSSISSIWSQIGGAYYSCANSMLDHLSRIRYDFGLKSYSLRLGPFLSEGLAKEYANHFATMGISPFAPMEIWRLYLGHARHYRAF